MNLDKASAASTSAPLAPPDWSMEVEREGSQFTAVVKRAGAVICGLSVVRPDGDEVAARTALAEAIMAMPTARPALAISMVAVNLNQAATHAIGLSDSDRGSAR